MATLAELEEETNKYKDTLVLDFFNVVLFKRVVEDPEDFYYEYVEGHTGKTILSSCVGWFIPLVDRLDKRQYNYLADVWNLNNIDQARKI